MEDEIEEIVETDPKRIVAQRVFEQIVEPSTERVFDGAEYNRIIDEIVNIISEEELAK